MIDPNGLLMIEPKNPAQPPIDDEYTELARRARRASVEGPFYRGFHTCVCGARSDNAEHRIDGMLSNSLIVHYVREHRDEVPQVELDKLRAFGQRHPPRKPGDSPLRMVVTLTAEQVRVLAALAAPGESIEDTASRLLADIFRR